jgi:riboflavin kinase/FMN adenylyltransferase
LLPPPAHRAFTEATDPAAPPPGLARAVYAVGNFDGVHLGHQGVLARAKKLAAEMGAPCAALTFEPHPADFFAKKPVVFRLTPPMAKARAIQGLGLDGLVALTFDAKVASLSAAEFVEEVLVKRLNAGAVVAGWDFHFGKGRLGTPAFLAQAGARHGFGVAIIDKIETAELAPVSSTAIRQALEKGDVRAAARLLGRNYSVIGPVVAGQKLGRTLDTPTANLVLEPGHRLAHGVYAIRVRIDDQSHAGVASFGVRPTIDNGAPLLEAHLFDFAGDLYGKTIEVEFVERIRGEEKFASLEALKAEMERDKAKARAILAA